MKVVSVVLVIVSLLDPYLYWPLKDARDVMLSAFTALWGVAVFFLADTKIDADDKGIRITAPHGVYALDWREVKTVEVNAFTTRFYGDQKAVAYNLLLAGKGKRDLKLFVANMIQRYQIPRGRPAGVENSQISQLVRNAKIRGWKLF
jgi:hypothetical protein